MLNGIRTTKLISPSTSNSTEMPQLGIRAGLQGHSVKAGGGQDSKEAATKASYGPAHGYRCVCDLFPSHSFTDALLSQNQDESCVVEDQTRSSLPYIDNADGHRIVSRLIPCPHPSFCVRQVTMAVSWNVITQRYVFDTIPSLFLGSRVSGNE